MAVISAFWTLFLVSAPWLLLGLLVAGWLKVYMPQSWLQRQLGEDSFLSIVKASVIGAPLPLCSCGVIPAALGLRRAGASKSATSSFLVATPETGVDSVSMSYALLGPFMAVIRPVAAVFSAIVTGVLTRFMCKEDSPVKTDSSCSSCCKSAPAATPEALPKWQQALKHASGDLLEDIAKWLLIGLVVAAVISVYVPQDMMAAYGSGILAMVFMVVIGLPMYICATASTPIAVGLLLSGVSPGAVLVFMLAGPATNIATIGVIKSEMGMRAVFAYLTGVIGSAVIAGLATDWAVSEFGFQINPATGHHDHAMTGSLEMLSALLLAGLLVRLMVWKPIQKMRVKAA